MRIIKEGTIPELTFTCKVCNTVFAVTADNCALIENCPPVYWRSLCPICKQTVKLYVDKNEA